MSSEAWEQKWKRVLKHLEDYNVILSAEELAWEEVLFQFLADASKRWDNIRVVVYLRRQDRWIESGWNQLIKERFFRDYPLTFKEHLNLHEETIKRYCHYKKRLDQIAQLIGRENVVVRVYEKQQFSGEDHSLESDFMSVLNIVPDWGKWKRCGSKNDRLCGNYIEIKRIINTAILDGDTGNGGWIAGITKEVSSRFSEGKGQGGYLTAGERENILKEFAWDNEQVAREYLGREDGILFYDKTLDYPVDNIHSCTPFEEDLIRLFYTIMSRVNSRNERLQAELAQVRRREDALAQKLLLQAAKGRKLLLFGAGQKCRELLEKTNIPFIRIADNDKRKDGKTVNGIEIAHTEKIDDWAECFVVVTCVATSEIEEQLSGLGLVKEDDYALAKEYFGYDF